jgi:hypothetical protein
MDKCSNDFVFVCKKFYVSSVFFELNSPVAMYVVSNLVQSEILKSHLSFNKADNFSGIKCVPRLHFFVLFGSLIKIQFWVSKLKKANVPCGSSWILNDSTGVVEVIKQLNLSRLEVDKASPLLLQSFDFSTLYAKIDLIDLKAHLKVLINRVFHWMLKLHHFNFLLV